MSKGTDNQALRLGIAAVLCGALQMAAANRSLAATLPDPLPGDAWITSRAGAAAASWSTTGNTMTVNQMTSRVILNWASFNISADGRVVFVQPDSNSIALNRIGSADRSEIFGSLEANGQIYLINQNGFLFGTTARVNTGGLLVSSLNLADDIFENGLLSAGVLGRQAPALEEAGNMKSIVVEAGARITTNAAGQRILLAAKNIDNRGNLVANDGQVVLAAGEKVYVTASDAPELRGLLVEVDGGGTVTNTGTVTAERGNITAVGLAINQEGRMSATTSVTANGSIRLLARDSVVGRIDGTKVTFSAQQGGTLTLGAQSITEISPDLADTATAVDEQAQAPSTIEMVGRNVEFQGGSQVTAAGGTLSVRAASNPDTPISFSVVDADASIVVDSAASINLAGSFATAPVTRNLVTVELRANELADSPLQRNGALRGSTVVVDARTVTESGKRGTDVGDVSGAIALIARGIDERTSVGGTARFETGGSIVVREGATIDVSGGAVTYTGGPMRTSQLIRADGSVIDIGAASPDDTYVGLINPSYRLVSDRWGVVQIIGAPGIGQYESGYVDGKDAGTVRFTGNAMALDGNFIGATLTGVNQRAASTLARGGQFIVGNGAAITLQGFRAPELGSSVDNGLLLSADSLSRAGFTRVGLLSNTSIATSEETIELAAGGSLSLTAPHVEILGDITVPAGSITATASVPEVTPGGSAQGGLFISRDVQFDVRGLWINDAVVPLDQPPVGALLTNAGRIALTQEVEGGVLEIGDGVSMHASGGAWLDRAGLVHGGQGGNISIRASGGLDPAGRTLRFGDNIGIDGYGVQGAAGGSITILAPRLDVVAGSTWLAAQEFNSNVATGGALQVGSALFSDYGFASFTLSADSYPLLADPTAGALTVRAGTSIALSPQTLMIGDAATALTSARNIEGLATATDVLAYQARAGSLTLEAVNPFPNPDNYGDLRLEQGARITGNPGSNVNLTSSGNLYFGGSIGIAGGNISLSIVKEGGDLDHGFQDRRLTMANGASIDVSGTTIYRPNDLSLQFGDVLAGGNINMRAGRGSIDVQANSMLDVSGTQGEFDWQDPLSGVYTHGNLSSVAGSVSLRAEESIALQGDLRARGGMSNGAQNTGGTLTVSLIRNIQQNAETYPTGPRVVQLVNDSGATPVSGIASLDADILAASGIDTLLLKADDQIAIGSGVDLTLERTMMFDAPGLAVLGNGIATVGAAYVALGPQEAISQLPVASGGDGTLVVNGDQIDLVGTLALQTTGQATLSSTGDIRLRGYGFAVGTTPGMLLAAGDLTLRAERVYPATGSRYTIDVTGASRTVTFAQAGSSPGVPLSVAGSLTVNAANIVQSGTVVAPFGDIALNAADRLQLAAGSFTSVSSDGAVLPYGRVDNGSTWVWGPDPVNPATISTVPDRTITLSSPAVELAAGAVVDIAGGGDLLAYSYTPGTGGKQDVLDPASAAYLDDTFVIVPTLAGQAAPFDPMMWSGSSVTAGQSIYLAEGSGVPAGIYQLLPARYALVPGAYLVTAVSGYQGLPAGGTAGTPDGATVVAGYYTFGDAANPAAVFSGFAVRPGSYARTLAEYGDRHSSEFFAAQAVASGTVATLPADAGTLVVAVSQTLDALGTVRGDAVTGGRRGSVEISAPAIEIVANRSGSNNSGTVELVSSSVSSWNIGRLLIGGVSDANGAINVTSSSVAVRAGASLAADEIVLVGSQAVAVDAGATVASNSGNSGAVPNQSLFDNQAFLDLTGANAASAGVLAVSDLGYLVTRRGVAQSANGATVTVASGARVATQGAVAVDGSGAVSIASGSVLASGASWYLGAAHVAFGGAGSANDGLAIDSSLQTELQSARSITINSGSSIDFTQALTLGNDAATRFIGLTAATLNNLGGGANSAITADRILLSGVSSQAAALSAGNGSIVFNADRIDIGAGEIGLSGFSSTLLNSAGLVSGTAIGGLSATGNVEIVSAAVTAGSGAQSSIRAEQGTLRFTQAATAAPGLSTLQTGGTLTLSGLDVVHSGHIIAPSGVVTLNALASLTLDTGAVIDVSGYQPVLASRGSNGGAIRLNSAGGLAVNAGATVAVAAGPQADAGSIDIFASGAAELAGNFIGTASPAADGGEFRVNAASLSDFGALNRSLEQGGFSGRRSYRVATGDLNLGSSDSITAREIELIADTGTIAVDGRLIAASDVERSSIALSARNDIAIGNTGVLNANAVDAGLNRAGAIELTTIAGNLQIAGTADIQAHGKGQSGSLTLRTPVADTDFINIASLPTSLSGVDAVYLEPVSAYTVSAAPTGADFEAIHANLVSYMSTAPTTIRDRLGLNGLTNVYIRPFADITSTGDLTLPGLDFGASGSAWRFGGEAAEISIRAGGNLNVASTLSDGFVAAGAGVDLLEEASVGLNLVAGADFASASRQATVSGAAADLVLGAGAIVRTGTGGISLSAARDITFGAGSSVYTGGLKGAPTFTNANGVSTYGDKGGSVRLIAGNDVVGSVVQQSVTDWQTRRSYVSNPGQRGAYWGVDVSSFQWNIGTLGGGDVDIVAGRNVTDVSAAVADSAGPVGGLRVDLGGGNLSVEAGLDIESGYFYVAKGLGDLRAWGAFSASGNRKNGPVDAGTLLISGEATYELAATGDVLFEGEAQAAAFSPTRPAEVNGSPNASYIYFLRYVADSALRVQSSGGGIRFNTITESGVFADFGSDSRSAFAVYPGTVELSAFGSDLDQRNSFALGPSRIGGLVMYAARDIVNSTGGEVAMSDVSLGIPVSTNVSFESSWASSLLNDNGAEILHAGDATPSYISAGRDINNLSAKLAEATQVHAGRDVRNLLLDTQQYGAEDITSISAGRDIYYTSANSSAEIRIGGTGSLQVYAGRNLNLGFSNGITTTGNLLNGNLPANQGADILAVAGLGAPMDANGFINTVVASDEALRQQLIEYVEERTGSSSLSFAAEKMGGNKGENKLDFATAADLFLALPQSEQAPFLTDALFDQLVASGREANADPELGFDRGYAALASLFPGSQDSNNPYAGDISLPFSRIYTLAGGNLSLLAPGGKIDVGLANPPNLGNLNLNRGPSQLGIVAQQTGNVHVLADGDVLVNTSRIFTLGGGDIAIWSSRGNIDAGKGAKSAISAPPPTLTVDAAGNVAISVSSAVSGSGIRTILTGGTTKPGDVDLIAPAGFVNAGDAGIGSAGNLNIAAQSVVGLDNIQVGGSSTGVPPETSGLAASLSGVTSSADSSTTSASGSITDAAAAAEGAAPIAQAALSWLEVFVVGLGEENCRQDDLECLKRQPPAR